MIGVGDVGGLTVKTTVNHGFTTNTNICVNRPKTYNATKWQKFLRIIILGSGHQIRSWSEIPHQVVLFIQPEFRWLTLQIPQIKFLMKFISNCDLWRFLTHFQLSLNQIQHIPHVTFLLAILFLIKFAGLFKFSK